MSAEHKPGLKWAKRAVHAAGLLVALSFIPPAEAQTPPPVPTPTRPCFVPEPETARYGLPLSAQGAGEPEPAYPSVVINSELGQTFVPSALVDTNISSRRFRDGRSWVVATAYSPSSRWAIDKVGNLLRSTYENGKFSDYTIFKKDFGPSEFASLAVSPSGRTQAMSSLRFANLDRAISQVAVSQDGCNTQNIRMPRAVDLVLSVNNIDGAKFVAEHMSAAERNKLAIVDPDYTSGRFRWRDLEGTDDSFRYKTSMSRYSEGNFLTSLYSVGFVPEGSEFIRPGGVVRYDIDFNNTGTDSQKIKVLTKSHSFRGWFITDADFQFNPYDSSLEEVVGLDQFTGTLYIGRAKSQLERTISFKSILNQRLSQVLGRKSFGVMESIAATPETIYLAGLVYPDMVNRGTTTSRADLRTALSVTEVRNIRTGQSNLTMAAIPKSEIQVAVVSFDKNKDLANPEQINVHRVNSGPNPRSTQGLRKVNTAELNGVELMLNGKSFAYIATDHVGRPILTGISEAAHPVKGTQTKTSRMLVIDR